jgi:hypothetical protein
VDNGAITTFIHEIDVKREVHQFGVMKGLSRSALRHGGKCRGKARLCPCNKLQHQV